jgi:hypothetical protein
VANVPIIGLQLGCRHGRIVTIGLSRHPDTPAVHEKPRDPVNLRVLPKHNWGGRASTTVGEGNSRVREKIARTAMGGFP